jgi:hypothetical protein
MGHHESRPQQVGVYQDKSSLVPLSRKLLLLPTPRIHAERDATGLHCVGKHQQHGDPTDEP